MDTKFNHDNLLLAYQLCTGLASENPKAYFAKHKEILIKDQIKTNGWKLTLFKSNDTQSMGIVYQGEPPYFLTKTAAELSCINSVAQAMFRYKKEQLSQISKRVKGWIKAYGQLDLHFGSSNGRYVILTRKNESIGQLTFFPKTEADYEKTGAYTFPFTVSFNRQQALVESSKVHLHVKDIITHDLLLILLPECLLIKGIKKAGKIGSVIGSAIHRMGPVVKPLGVALKVEHGIHYKEHITESMHPSSHVEGPRHNPPSQKVDSSSAQQINRHPDTNKQELHTHQTFKSASHEILEAMNKNFSQIAESSPQNVHETQVSLEKVKQTSTAAKADFNLLTAFQEKAKRMHSKLKQEWTQKTETNFFIPLMRGVNEMARCIYIKQQNKFKKECQQDEIKEMSYRHENHKKNLKKMSDISTPLSLPSVQLAVLQGISPYWSISEHLRVAEHYIMEYNQTQQKLEGLLQQKEQFGQQLNTEDQQLSHLDQEINGAYYKLLNKRQKVIEGIQKAETAISFTGGLLYASHSLLGIGGQIVGQTLGYIEGQHDGKRRKLTSHYQQILAESESNHQLLNGLQQANIQQRDQIESALMSERRRLLNTSKLANSSEYRKSLHTTRESLRNEIDKQRKTIKNKQGQIEFKQKQNEQFNTQVTGIEQSHHLSKHKHRQEELARQKENIENNKIQILSLKNQIQNEKSNLEEKQQLLNDYDQAIAQAEEYTLLNDFFFTEVTRQIEKQQSKDKDVRILRERMSEGFANWEFAAMSRQKVYNTGCSAFENLFLEIATLSSFMQAKALSKGAQRGQILASIARQMFNIEISWETFKLGHQALQAAWKILQKTDPQATLVDLVKKVGPAIFVGNYVTPGVQLVAASLTVLRCSTYLMSGDNSLGTNVSHTLIQLKLFTEAFANYTDSQFKTIHAHLNQNQEQLLAQLKIILEEAKHYHQEILTELRETKDFLNNTIQENHALQDAVRVTNIGEKITEKSKKLHYFLLNATEEKKQKILDKFLLQIGNWLEKAQADIHRGLINTRDGHQSIVTLTEACRRPDLYSGLIGKATNYAQPIPSFFLLYQIARAYSLLADSKITLKTISTAQTFQLHQIEKTLSSQLKIIRGIPNHLMIFAKNAYEIQRQILSVWKSKIEESTQRIENGKDSYLQALDLTRLEHYFKDFSHSNRFTIAEVFVNNKLVKEKRQQNYIKGGLLPTAAVITAGVGAGIALHVLTPVLIGAAIGNAILGGGLIANKKENGNHTIVDNLLEQSTPAYFTATFDKNPFLPQEPLVIELWVNKDGTPVTIVTAVNRIFKTLATIGERQVAERYLFHAIYEISSKTRNILPQADSLITVNQLKKIHANYRNFSISSYKSESINLLANYRQFLMHVLKGEKIDPINRFSKIGKKEHIILSSNSTLVPLLFPDEFLKYCEELLRLEISWIALDAKVIFTPSYDFKWDKTKEAYVLTFSYLCIKSNQEELRYDFDIAKIDKITVESFKSTTLKENQDQVSPNLNECLLHAMYTNYNRTSSNPTSMGLPGSETVLINEGRWIFVQQNPFPGIYQLLKIDPSKEIHFNSQSYTREMSEQLNRYAYEGHSAPFPFLVPRLSPRSIHLNAFNTVVDRVQKKLEEEHHLLKNNYTSLVALCSLLTSFDMITIKSFLETDLGMLDPENLSHLLFMSSNPIPYTQSDELIEKFKLAIETAPSELLARLKVLLPASDQTDGISLEQFRENLSPEDVLDVSSLMQIFH